MAAGSLLPVTRVSNSKNGAVWKISSATPCGHVLADIDQDDLAAGLLLGENLCGGLAHPPGADDGYLLHAASPVSSGRHGFIV
jgi:hypothetical protein